MKSQEQRAAFIQLRAEGRSYSYIAAELHISKSTCSSWEHELKDAIDELKRERLEELYTAYHMTREARIKRLGDTLDRITDALDGVDLTELPAAQLLDYNLKYTAALAAEYTGTAAHRFTNGITPTGIMDALGDLLDRVRAGEVTAEQANRESTVLTNLLRAYDTVEVKAKLDALDAIISGRM